MAYLRQLRVGLGNVLMQNVRIVSWLNAIMLNQSIAGDMLDGKKRPI